jgi:hypothetical protein
VRTDARWMLLQLHMAGAFVGAALLGCADRPAIDPRLPSEIAAPSLEDWRAAASDLAAGIAQVAAAQGQTSDVALEPVQGEVPAYFDDLLLVKLIEHGVRITEPSSTSVAPAHISCRATSGDLSPYPRGLVTEPAQPTSHIVVLCFLAQEGAYIAAQQRALPIRPPRRPKQGVVMEVTG